jgi:hypothetical protein
MLKAIGWVVTFLGWYFVVAAVFAAIKSFSEYDDPPMIILSLIGGALLAALATGLVVWGTRIRMRTKATPAAVPLPQLPARPD